VDSKQNLRPVILFLTRARRVLNGKNTKPVSPIKNEFAYSNFAHSSSENRRFALNHIRNRLKGKEKGDYEWRLHYKLKSLIDTI
jgi:hypothetical protein